MRNAIDTTCPSDGGGTTATTRLQMMQIYTSWEKLPCVLDILMPVRSPAYSQILKMEIIFSSEMSVDFKDLRAFYPRRENLL
jgi:hypothetical protein